MADNINALVGDNDAPATWTDVNDITPDQKVLIGTIDEKSGNMKAEWRASSQAAVFKEKTITENSVYDPQQEGADGYSMVTVEVPNTYVAEDEGKVVSSGALVAQTARSENLTENGTYDTTENNSVTVNVAVPASDMNAKFVDIGTHTFGPFFRELDTIAIPEGITVIASGTFSNGCNISMLTIPTTLNDFQEDPYVFEGGSTVGTYIFADGFAGELNYKMFAGARISQVIIPGTTTGITAGTFSTDYSTVDSIKFKSTTPIPADVDAFNNLPSDCIIYVPAGSLSAYTSAANYPDSNTYTYIEY